MSEVVRCKPHQLAGLIKRRMMRLERRVNRACYDAARDGAKHIKDTAPKAFGDLRSSVHVVEDSTRTAIVIDAPHAAAVEIGSAPHTPDIERLTAWVRLRGMQGLHNLRSTRLYGPTTRGHAQSVKALISEHTVHSPDGDFSPIDTPRKVAEKIAAAIEKEGTRPYWYARNSLPVISMRLASHVRKAMGK